MANNLCQNNLRLFYILLWKCWKTESRKKLRLVGEIVLPIVMFLIAVVIKYSIKISSDQPASYYAAKPLISSSSGITLTLRGLICQDSYYPTCSNDQPAINLFCTEQDQEDNKMSGPLCQAIRCISNVSLALSSLINNVSLVYSPINNLTSKLMLNYVRPRLDLASRMACPNLISSSGNTSSGHFYVEFLKCDWPQFEYSLRILKTDLSETVVYVLDAIDKSIIAMHVDGKNGSAPVRDVPTLIKRFPKKAIPKDKAAYLKQVGKMLGLFPVLGWILVAAMIGKSLVLERERQLRLITRMMGVPTWLHLISWFAFWACLMATSIILLIIILSQLLVYVSLAIVFIFLMAYAFATISMSVFVSSFFNSANFASLASGLVFFLAYLTGFGLSEVHGFNLSLNIMLASSVLPNVAQTYAWNLIVQHETSQKPLSDRESDKITLEIIIGMLLFDSIAYFMAALCVENLGNVYNLIRNRKIAPNAEHLALKDELCFETEPAHLTIACSLENITKEFVGSSGRKLALDGLSLNLFQGQITGLLGQNGAGKTTAMSIMTGLLAPTAGRVRICGHEVSTNAARHLIGFCPQFDILYDDLTVSEHLWFYAALRLAGETNISSKTNRLRLEVEQMLAQTNLLSKKDSFSQTLSGGMKRRLSVATAFIGCAQFVVLDEPTAGVDVRARRAIWDLLIAMRRSGRTILLSTHHMDEAELLSDRIAIMKSGSLVMCGSPAFLKRNHGTGYLLKVVGKTKADLVKIRHALVAMVDDSSVGVKIHERGLQIVCPVRYQNVGQLPNICSSLEAESAKLGISSYNISDSSLEDVFLKCCDEADQQLILPNRISADHVPVYTFLKGLKLVWQQFYASLIRRFQRTSRNVKGLLFEHLLPVMFVLSGVAIVKSIDNNCLLRYSAGRLEHAVNRDSNLLQVNLNKSFFSSSSLPFISNHSNHLNTSASYLMAIMNQTDMPKDLSGLDVDNYLLKNSSFSDVHGGWSFVSNSDSSNYSTIDSLTVWYNDSDSLYAYTNFANNMLFRLLTTAPPLVKNNFSNFPFPIIKAAIIPVSRQYDNGQVGLKSCIESSIMTSAVLAIMTLLAMSFVPASFVMFLVEDRQSHSKHVQLISGLHPSVYLVANFVWDFASYLIPTLASLIAFTAFNIDSLPSETSIGHLFALLTGYGFAICWYRLELSYPLSSFIPNPSTAFVITASGNFFLGAAPTCATLLLDTIGAFQQGKTNINVSELNDALKISFRWSLPQFCLCRGLFDLAMSGKHLKPFHLIYFTFPMLVHGVAWLLLNLTLENYAQTLAYRCCLPCKRPDDNDVTRLEEDHSALQVDSSDASKYNLVVRKLTKYYTKAGKPISAVDHLSFCIPPGQCLGLLGENGAGKSTTFKMLTGLLAPSSGTVQIRGVDIKTLSSRKSSASTNLIGYCPQSDSSTPHLTGRENLAFFARIRGVPERKIGQIVNFYLEQMNLCSIGNQPAEFYSGGNKRQLSIAIAIVGEPALLLLDEPTAGVDPAARRHIWASIERLLVNGTQSVLLTSHSIDECEVLCSRLAIMAKGRLRCIGTPQQLKDRFGTDYLLTLRFAGSSCLNNVNQAESLIKALKKHIGSEVSLKEMHGNVALVAVSNTTRTVLGPLFTFLIGVKNNVRLLHERFGLVDFTVAQSSLGDIFEKLCSGDTVSLADTISTENDNNDAGDSKTRSSNAAIFTIA